MKWDEKRQQWTLANVWRFVKTPKPRVKTSVEVLPYVDQSKPVRVYRNLHKKCLSVKQGGLVVCHVDNIVLKNCTFIVSEAGRQRVLKEKRKNVHAYVQGTVIDARETDNVPCWPDKLIHHVWHEIYYNPYNSGDFTTTGQDPKPLTGAEYVDIDSDIGDMIAFNLTYKNVKV